MITMKNFLRVGGPFIVLALLLLGGWLLVKDAYFPSLNPSGSVAESERNILLFTVGLSAVVIIPVWIMLVVFSLRYREGNKKAKYKPEWAHNTALEVVWWGIPILIIAILATTVWITTHKLDPYNEIVSDKETVEVQVVALEWKWLFIYPEYGIATVNDLTMPVKTPVHFTLAADAPMSAFWVPALGSQIYTMNGMSSQLNLIGNEIGTFSGYNTNIAGEGYAKMTFDVPVVSQVNFEKWVEKVQSSDDVLDWKRYEKLMKQSTEDKPMYFKLGYDDLYHDILMKYMSPMDSGKKLDQDKPNDSHDQHHGHGMMDDMKHTQGASQ